MAVIAEKGNLFRFTSSEDRRVIDDDQVLIDKIIRSAQQVLVCQLTLSSAHEALLQLVEEYTGEHWTKWGL